jgi:hypothetical protein
MADMTRGIALARAYYVDVVAPLLGERWPHLPHAAARLGSGQTSSASTTTPPVTTTGAFD